jgi:hypothetical protein
MVSYVPVHFWRSGALVWGCAGWHMLAVQFFQMLWWVHACVDLCGAGSSAFDRPAVFARLCKEAGVVDAVRDIKCYKF